MRGLIGALLLTSAGGALTAQGRFAGGPFDLLLFPTSKAPSATGHATLVYADSPFGLAVTEDGRARYKIQIVAAGLPAASSLGPYSTYVAWAATPELTAWVRLGTVINGTNVVGIVDFNKFLVVVSAESSLSGTAPQGPTVLHGTSPSGYIQSFLSHPLFRNLPQ
jgi:hypothetical protein